MLEMRMKLHEEEKEIGTQGRRFFVWPSLRYW